MLVSLRLLILEALCFNSGWCRCRLLLLVGPFGAFRSMLEVCPGSHLTHVGACFRRWPRLGLVSKGKCRVCVPERLCTESVHRVPLAKLPRV